MSGPEPVVLLTGATGYVGGRLLHRLEEEGEPVRCLTRRPEALRERVAVSTEVAAGDVLDPASLRGPLEGVGTAYYLVHSLGGTGSYREQDRRAAAAFGAKAREAGVRRIIYLGGLGSGGDLSPHLASRQEVGEILHASGVPTIELRASIILGSGSLSFEMIRALVDRLPVMVTPRWVRTLTQPIAIEDVMDYLVAALRAEPHVEGIFEIAGCDRASYLDLMKAYARQRGLRRIFVPVPLLTPRLSSLWLGLVTPVHARVGAELIEGVRNETVVTDDRALRSFDVRPRGYREAIARALANEDREFAETRWSNALSSAGDTPSAYGGERFGKRRVDSRAVQVPVAPERAFEPIRRIGGRVGWYHANFLWRLRGFLDLLAGGVGLRRGRRDPESAVTGDALDFWRVEAYEPGRLLRLKAEMKVPGRAWLQFEVERVDAGSTIRQTAIFDPRGLLGLAYWYGLYPLHRFVFSGMLRGIARAAVKGSPGF